MTGDYWSIDRCSSIYVSMEIINTSVEYVCVHIDVCVQKYGIHAYICLML